MPTEVTGTTAQEKGEHSQIVVVTLPRSMMVTLPMAILPLLGSMLSLLRPMVTLPGRKGSRFALPLSRLMPRC